MDDRIEKSLLFITKSYQSELRLADLADQAYLSEFHFHRLFKSETGQTPLQYINSIRLEHAAYLLVMYPSCHQVEVAFECGYSSPAVFSRAFRTYHKMSPSEFRTQKSPLLSQAIYSGREKFHFSIKKNEIPITYLASRKIPVKRVSLTNESLNIAYSELMKSNPTAQNGVGFYIEPPCSANILFDKRIENCRHYIGLESHISKDSSFLEVRSGYYTHISVQGDLKKARKEILSFKENKIDGSGYLIDSSISIEQIKLPPNPNDFDYSLIPRDIYIPIVKE